jgi:hypothetical protein
MVSGRAIVATSSRALRPSRWPISASVARSASDSFTRPSNRIFRIRFSAARYSLRSSNSWSTVPVMWARIRHQFISLPAARKPIAVYDRPYAEATLGRARFRLLGSHGFPRAIRELTDLGELTPLHTGCDAAGEHWGGSKYCCHAPATCDPSRQRMRGRPCRLRFHITAHRAETAPINILTIRGEIRRSEFTEATSGDGPRHSTLQT